MMAFVLFLPLGQPLLSGQYSFPQGWPFNRGSTVIITTTTMIMIMTMTMTMTITVMKGIPLHYKVLFINWALHK